MARIVVYEHLSATARPEAAAEAELLPQGLAMRDAMLADLCALPGLQIEVVVGPTAVLRPDAARPAPTPLAAGTSLAWHPLAPGEPPADGLRRLALPAQGEPAIVWAVAPETGGVLAALQAAVPPSQWLGADAAALALASSKSATLAALAARGIATPLAWLDQPAIRWVAKPDDGAGALDTRVFAERTDALAWVRTREATGQPMTVEPMVPGEALSVSLMAGEGWVQALAFNRQQIDEGPDGTLAFRGVEPGVVDPRTDPRGLRLHLLALDVARAVPGLLGPAGIDLVWHAERGPVVIEVNPRLTSAFVGLSARLGRNLAQEALRALSTAEGRRG